MFYPKKSFFIFLKITVFTLVSVQLSFSQCTLQSLGGASLPLNINLTHGTYFGFTNAQTTPVISANITNMYDTAEQVAENYYSLDQGANSSMWFLRVRGLNNSVSLDLGGCTYTFTVTEQKELNFDLNQHYKPYDGSKVIDISVSGSGVSVGEIYEDNVHINLTNFLHWETSAADVGTYFTITAVFSDDTQNFELVGTDEHIANYYVNPSLTRSGDDFGVDDFSADTNWETPLPQRLEVNINQIDLTINGPTISVPIGQEIPIVDWAIPDNNFTGFVNGEDRSVLTTQPVLPDLNENLYDSADETVRTIPFEISGATSTNYNITHVDGLIDVYDPREAITLTLDDINVATNNSVTLSPSAIGNSSGVSVPGVFSFNILSGESFFSLSASTLTGITAGNGVVEVSFLPNDTNNYQEVTPISVTVEVVDSTNLDPYFGVQAVAPDSTFDFGNLISVNLGSPANGFSSSDTDVVTVTENGIVTGVGIGTALVYVFHNNGFFVSTFEVSNRLNQDPIVVTNTTVSNGTQVEFTGGNGTGAVSYQAFANRPNFNCSCSADGVMTIVQDDGYTLQPEDKCGIIVTKQGDNDYNATSSALAYFPVSTSSTDTTAPTAPTVTTANGTTVTGTAEAGSTVTVYASDGSTSLGTAIADGSGNYTVTMSTVQSDGASISVTATDADGNESSSTSTSIGFGTIDSSWSGAVSGDWSAVGNWSNGIPSTNYNVVIPAGLTNYPTASSAVVVNTMTLASGASFIAQSTFTGAVTYNRTLSSNNWYLVSSPVVGETLEGLISNHTFATGSGGNIGIAPYANDGSAWDYQTTAATGSLASGSGYSVKLAAAGAVSFNGTFPATDVSIGITQDANGLNLVGNPYPSYIAANSSADAVNNLLTINSTTLSEETLWFWDSGSNSYVTYNQASSSKFVSPAQGFFVNSNGTNSFQFTEAMQSHQSSDSFQRSTATRPEINLMLSNDTDTRSTDIFFIEGTTTGWDNGYDSSIFGETANSFAIYTHLVSDSEGQNLGIQSLPETDLESMIIPLGINAVSGTEITISVATQNLPEGIDVYLEDKVAGSFTLLENDANYTTTLSAALNGIGRYYLHTSAQVLGTDDLMHANISIYTISENSIRIVGVQSGSVKVRVYSVLGKQMHTTSFQGNGMNDVDLPKVAKGVYLIRLETEIGVLNKKIFIE